MNEIGLAIADAPEGVAALAAAAEAAAGRGARARLFRRMWSPPGSERGDRIALLFEPAAGGEEVLAGLGPQAAVRTGRYRRLSSWTNGDTESELDPLDQEVVFAVRSDAVAGRDDEFNAWYDRDHIPEVCRVAGLQAATRFSRRAAGVADHEYLTVFMAPAEEVPAGAEKLLWALSVEREEADRAGRRPLVSRSTALASGAEADWLERCDVSVL